MTGWVVHRVASRLQVRIACTLLSLRRHGHAGWQTDTLQFDPAGPWGEQRA